MKSFNIVKKNQLGFSLVEILVAMAVLSVGALITMRTVQNSNEQLVRTDTQADFEQFIFAMDNYLGRRDVCDKQFKVPLGSPEAQFTKLVDPDLGDDQINLPQNAVYELDKVYLGGKAKIKSMTLIKVGTENPTPAMKVVFERKEKLTSPDWTIYTRTIPVIHELDGEGNKIYKCYETDSSIFDIKSAIAERMCRGASTTGFDNGVFDKVTGTCHFYGFENGDLNCTDGKALTSITFDDTYTFTPVCTPILVPPLDCSAGWIKTMNEDGSTVCLTTFADLVDPNPTILGASVGRMCGLTINGNGQQIGFSCSGGTNPPTDDCDQYLQGGPLYGELNDCGIVPPSDPTPTEPSKTPKCSGVMAHLNARTQVTCYTDGTYSTGAMTSLKICDTARPESSFCRLNCPSGECIDGSTTSGSTSGSSSGSSSGSGAQQDMPVGL